VVSYDIDPPPAAGECPWHDFAPELCYFDGVGYYPDLQRWPHGLVPNPTDEDGNIGTGDNLIPEESTTLDRGGLLDLPDQDNQELNIPDTGHVIIMAEEETQDIVGVILTGLADPGDILLTNPDASNIFPVNTDYVAPVIGLNNSDVVWAFLVHSPVDVMVTDSQGRRIGYDPASGHVINEIPGGYYTGNSSDVEFIMIGQEEDNDTFTVTTTGTDSGEYAISIHHVDDNHIYPVGLVQGTAQPDQVATDVVELKDTQLTLEAEDFVDNLAGNGQSWSLQSELGHYTGSGYLKVTPDRDVLYSETELTTAPELQYTLTFDTIGTYYIWLRGAGANAAGDSVYAALAKQGESSTPSLPISGFLPRRWSWSNQTTSGTPAVVTVDTVGTYTLSIWPREDGVHLDRVLITNNELYRPVDVGPDVSGE
jgi:hypothetical protein